MAETVNVIVAIEDHERLAKKGSLFAKRLAVLEAARRASVSRPPSGARNGGMA